MIRLIYGEQFAPAANALRILFAGITFMFLASMLRDVGGVINRTHVALFGGLLGAAVNVTLNFYLISRCGHLGTSLSTTIAEVSICILLAADLRRNGYNQKLAQSFVKLGLALILSIMFMLALHEWNFIIIALIGFIIYTITLL